MGCCGCNLQSSAITAVVFGFVQSLIGLIGGGVFVNLFDASTVRRYSYSYSGYNTYLYNTLNAYDVCKAVSGAHVAFNIFWLISTILLIVAISKNHVGLHRQWTIVTSLVLATDVILFIVACTQLQYIYNYQYTTTDNTRIILLLGILSRFGIIGFVCDICLAIFVYQRSNEILRGPCVPATHVIVAGGQTGQFIQGGHVIQPAQTMMMPGQQYYVQSAYGQPAMQQQTPYPDYGQPVMQQQTPYPDYGQPGMQQMPGYPGSHQSQPPAYNTAETVSPDSKYAPDGKQ